MVNFYTENKIDELVEHKLAEIINWVAIDLCSQIDNGQNMINSNELKKEILILNEYIQYLLNNNFSEYEFILERKIETICHNKMSLAATLFYNRINQEITKLLNNYDNNLLIYNIIFEKQMYLNKIFFIENKIFSKN